MNAGRIVLIVLVFLCLLAGGILVVFSKMFGKMGKGKKGNDAYVYRRGLKIKLIGYVVLMFALVFAIGQSFLN